MNNTNRALNRTLLIVVGLVVAALGAAAVALATVPAIADAWREGAPGVLDAVSSALVATPFGDTGHSWLWIALVAVLLTAVLLLIRFIARQGHGRTGDLVSRETSATDAGRVSIDSAVAEQSLAAALASRPEIVASRVSTYRVGGRPVLKVSATARRGVSPRELTETIEGFIRSWDDLLGIEIPVLVQISGGFRTRVSTSTRLQ